MTALYCPSPIIIPFYSHKTGLYRCMSQFYQSSFTVNGDQYSCAEQWMMSEKARKFPGNEDILKKIMEETDPYVIRTLGRKVKNYVDSEWSSVRYDVVVQGTYAKFSQVFGLSKILLDTHNAILVEASPTDRIWGCGLDGVDPDIRNPAKWRGTNLLGKALMDVRAKLLLTTK